MAHPPTNYRCSLLNLLRDCGFVILLTTLFFFLVCRAIWEKKLQTPSPLSWCGQTDGSLLPSGAGHEAICLPHWKVEAGGSKVSSQRRKEKWNRHWTTRSGQVRHEKERQNSDLRWDGDRPVDDSIVSGKSLSCLRLWAELEGLRCKLWQHRGFPS